MKKIEELKKKLQLAEQNYKESRADAYLVEQHRIKEEIAMLEREEREAVPVSPDGEQSPATEPVGAKANFRPPINVDELPSAITRHIVAVSGAGIRGMDDKTIAIEQRKLLYEARSFYEGQNDKDAIERVESMIEKATVIIDGATSTDGDHADSVPNGSASSEDGQKPVEATEPTPEAPQTKEPTKNPQPRKKATSGQKKSGKGGKK